MLHQQKSPAIANNLLALAKAYNGKYATLSDQRERKKIYLPSMNKHTTYIK